MKQDELTVLEEALVSTNKDEVHELFLGCSRLDRNTERERIQSRLMSAVSGYGTLAAYRQVLDRALCLHSGRFNR
jgi:hypothetical protein